MNSSKYIKYAIGEIVLVVIGILIALGINNWNDKRKTEATISNSLVRIKTEIKNNQKRIEAVFDYHVMLRDTLNKITLPKSSGDMNNTFGFWKGHQIFRLQDAAFQTTVQSGISQHMDIDVLEKLNTLYTKQTFYNELSKSVTQGLYSADFSSPEGLKKVVHIIKMTMEDLYYLESHLRAEFEACLKAIDELQKE